MSKPDSFNRPGRRRMDYMADRIAEIFDREIGQLCHVCQLIICRCLQKPGLEARPQKEV